MKGFNSVLYALVALGVLYAANRMDQRHFETAQHTLNSIHEDRVVAQDIIYQLSSVFNERHLKYITDTTSLPNNVGLSKQNERIENLVNQFKNTVLTNDEKFQLEQFQKNYQKLISYENSLNSSSTLTDIKNTFSSINENLDRLTEIQLSESKNLQALGQKSLDSNSLMSMTEIALMMVLATVILFFVFYKRFK
jgi:transcriptional regulator with PAS, ATPase and Fis domain